MSVLLSCLEINILVCMVLALRKLFAGGRTVLWENYWSINLDNGVLVLLQLFYITIDKSFDIPLLFRFCTLFSSNESPAVLSQLHVSGAGAGPYCQMYRTCSSVYMVFSSAVGQLHRKPCMHVSLEVV